MSVFVGLKCGKVHTRTETSEYYCARCGYPVTDHDSYCRECGGTFQKSFETDRTCRVIDHELSCDDCQCEKWTLSCGHEVITESNDCLPIYCTECGAKVIQDADY